MFNMDGPNEGPKLGSVEATKAQAPRGAEISPDQALKRKTLLSGFMEKLRPGRVAHADSDPVETRTQMQDTMGATVQLLGEIARSGRPGNDPINRRENGQLKATWLDGAANAIDEAIPTQGDKRNFTYAGAADAALADQSARGFFTVFAQGLGSLVRYDNMQDFLANAPKVSVNDMSKDRDAAVVRVYDSRGHLYGLASTTKIDGLQFVLTGPAIEQGARSATKEVKPILVISNPKP